MSINPLDAISAISGIFSRRSERKALKQQAELKLKNAKLNKDANLQMSDAEWEAVSVDKQDTTWKDEYITVVITLPIPLIFMGAIWFAFKDDSRLLDGVIKGIEELHKLNVDMGFLMSAVVLAAVGLKTVRGIR